MEVTAEVIAQHFNGEIVGDPNVKVSSVAKIENGKPGNICFLANPKYDFAYIYAGAWGDMQGPASILRNCIGAQNDGVASYFDQFKSRYTTKLDEFLDHFQ